LFFPRIPQLVERFCRLLRVAIIVLMRTASLDILEKTQLPAEQARGILRAMELELSARDEAFATKDDVRTEIQAAVHLLELKFEALRSELNAVEGRLTRWTFTCILGQTAVMAAALYFAITHLRP
jgi:hypothetical protein